MVPESIHTLPMEGHWKFLGGPKLLEEKFEAKLEFPGGAKQKTFHGEAREYGYFLELIVEARWSSG